MAPVSSSSGTPHAPPRETLGRVLCLTSCFPGTADDSAGIFVARLEQSMHELGWMIDVITPHRPGLAPFENRGGVRVFRFRYLWPESLETFGHTGSSIVNLRNNPLNYLKVAPLVTSQGLHVIRKLLANRYDIIHSHWIIPQGFHGMIGSMAWGVPHVVTVHGGDIYSFNWVLLRWLKSIILKQAQAITVNSYPTMQQVRSMAPRHPRIVSAPMGIDEVHPDGMATERIRQQYRAGAGPLLLFVGRIVAEKGVGDVIKAVHILQNDLPEVRAVIVGDGQDRAHFSRYAHELGVSGRVAFVGQVPPAQVANYYAAADVFIGPSKKAADGWTEGLGMTFIEAMYARLPVIATRSGGIVDTVEHEVTGLLVNENSPGEIAAAVKRLVASPELVKDMIEKGYKVATEQYSQKLVAQKFSRLFADVLESRRQWRGKQG